MFTFYLLAKVKSHLSLLNSSNKDHKMCPTCEKLVGGPLRLYYFVEPYNHRPRSFLVQTVENIKCKKNRKKL